MKVNYKMNIRSTCLFVMLTASMIACGSSAVAKHPADDAGAATSTTTEQPSDNGTSTPDAGPTNQASCVAACETKYPAAAQEGHAFDTSCMTGVCEAVCDNIGASGQDFAPDPDAGSACNTNAAMSYPIKTPSVACSDCLATHDSCCKQWITIFGSTEGQALNACSNTCFSSFKN
jgi:hypothetical protein